VNINCSLNQIIPASEFISSGIIVRNHIVCKDGFRISVQASAFHYCYPRCTQKYHEEFELYCDISNDKDLLELYHDGTICLYVPAVIVEKLILRHGSIDWNKTPRKIKTKEKRYAKIHKTK
jgi:hypothetical protein